MRYFLAFLTLVSSALLLGCGGAAQNENAETAKKVEQAVAAAPTKSMIVDLQKRAFEAWKNKDMAFWNTHLDDKYLSFAHGKRVDKAGEIKMLGDMKCEIASYAIDNEKLVPVGTDAIILTAKATVEGTCSGQKIPSPMTFGTLYIRSGDTWKAAYHNETPVVDPKDFKPSPKKAEAAKKEADTELDPLTSTLFAIEKRGWAEWKAKNRTPLESLMTDDATLVDAMGNVLVGKQAVVNWLILPKCEIKAAEPVSPTASEISPVIAILTFKGTASGTCENRPLSDFWGTTIFQKGGGEWRTVYQFRVPA